MGKFRKGSLRKGFLEEETPPQDWPAQMVGWTGQQGDLRAVVREEHGRELRSGVARTSVWA